MLLFLMEMVWDLEPPTETRLQVLLLVQPQEALIESKLLTGLAIFQMPLVKELTQPWMGILIICILWTSR